MGHSAGGHLALLYAYMSAEGATVIDPDSDTEQYFTLSPVQLVISEAGPIHLTVDEVDKLLPQNQNEICAMAGISSLNDTNAQNALNAVSPYCVAQDIEDKSKLPYTILAYGNIFDNGNATNSDGLIPIQPAIELDKLLNSNDGVYTKDAKCSLFELNNVSHGDFSGVVHPDTETYYLRKPSICLHSISTNNCESCSTRYENLNIKNIEDYYGAISSKLNLLSTSN